VRGRACGEESGAEKEAGGWPGVSGEAGSSGGTRPGRADAHSPLMAAGAARCSRPRGEAGEAEGSRRGRAQAAEAESDRGGDGAEPGTSAELRAHGGPWSECGRPGTAPAQGSGTGRRPRETGGGGSQSGGRGPRDVTPQGPGDPAPGGSGSVSLPVAMATQAARQPGFPPCQHRLTLDSQ
jgi:hypothetical protein